MASSIVPTRVCGETVAVAVAVGEPSRILLVAVGADLPGDLGLHELANEPVECLAKDIGMLSAQELAEELI